MDSLKKLPGAPERIYLWPEGKMPQSGAYQENPEYRYNHDPDFAPYMYEFLLPEEIIPKGAIVLCFSIGQIECRIQGRSVGQML